MGSHLFLFVAVFEFAKVKNCVILSLRGVYYGVYGWNF